MEDIANLIIHHDLITPQQEVLSGVYKKFSEWCQKTNKIEDTNKLT
jgi:hypothetical protein